MSTSIDLSSYPIILQILMNTDGTVTDLIRLLAKEELKVIKLDEEIIKKTNILKRKIYLQGTKSKTNWLCAQSEVYLNNLDQNFVDDLLQHNIPIGTLWTKYEIENYKKITRKKEEISTDKILFGYDSGEKLLSRTYQVFNNKKIIMEITERFPVSHYSHMSF